jgi:hypothetical protein
MLFSKANLQPGTVVDGFITSHPKEFYLCSHKGLMVSFDAFGFGEDGHQ